jgi:hypothetical protein
MKNKFQKKIGERNHKRYNEETLFSYSLFINNSKNTLHILETKNCLTIELFNGVNNDKTTINMYNNNTNYNVLQNDINLL